MWEREAVARLKILSLIVSILLGCSTQPSNPNLAIDPVTVEATASSCGLAEKNAKIKAVDYASGTFVHGQRTLVADQDYSEQMNEYTSGVIQKYNVLEKKGRNPCSVKIQAWVAPGTKAMQIQQQPEPIAVDEINMRARQIQNNQQFLAQHLRDTNAFTVTLGQAEVSEADPGWVSVSMLMTDLQPPQRWLDDLEAYLSIHGAPTIYSQDSRAKALSRLLTFERQGTKQPPAAWDFEICFEHHKQEEIRCYTGEINRKIIRALQSPIIELEVRTSRKSQTETQGTFGLSLYTHKPVGFRYTAQGYAPRTDFPLISAYPMPQRVGFTYQGRQLPESAEIKARFRFGGLSQFPIN